MGWSAALAVALCCSAASAQSSGDTKKCKPKDANCAPAANGGASGSAPQSTPDAFPFPVEDSKHGADAEGSAPAPPPAANGLPQMPTSGVPDPPADSEKPMGTPAGDAGSSSSGSSSSSSSDDDSDVAPTTAAPNAPVKAAPLKNYGARDSDEVVHAKLEKTRVPDDLKVGKFYLSDGNASGAYLRFKDAVEHDSEDPDARFYLAEAASKLSKRDEAVRNYRECLKLDPGGDHDKTARRALASLGASAQ